MEHKNLVNFYKNLNSSARIEFLISLLKLKYSNNILEIDNPYQDILLSLKDTDINEIVNQLQNIEMSPNIKWLSKEMVIARKNLDKFSSKSKGEYGGLKIFQVITDTNLKYIKYIITNGGQIDNEKEFFEYLFTMLTNNSKYKNFPSVKALLLQGIKNIKYHTLTDTIFYDRRMSLTEFVNLAIFNIIKSTASNTVAENNIPLTGFGNYVVTIWNVNHKANKNLNLKIINTSKNEVISS